MTASNNIDVQVLAERVTYMQKTLLDQETHINKLEDALNTLENNIEEREHRNLLWGVAVLGSAVTTLASIIWSYRSTIFK